MAHTIDNKPDNCSQCGRSPLYCVCEFVRPAKVKTEVVVLQHPQEPGMDIGTAAIVASVFPQALVKTGLSWPNLKKIVGAEVDNQRWGVLYLGSVHVETLPRDRAIVAVDKKGVALDAQDQVLSALRGIVLLDGTWSQAKTLWWRNAWLLKLRRLVLNPRQSSLYDQIRKEPRGGCLSTLESAVEAIAALERRDDLRDLIAQPLGALIERTKKNRPRQPKKDYRRKRRFHRARKG